MHRPPPEDQRAERSPTLATLSGVSSLGVCRLWALICPDNEDVSANSSSGRSPSPRSQREKVRSPAAPCSTRVVPSRVESDTPLRAAGYGAESDGGGQYARVEVVTTIES